MRVALLALAGMLIGIAVPAAAQGTLAPLPPPAAPEPAQRRPPGVELPGVILGPPPIEPEPVSPVPPPTIPSGPVFIFPVPSGDRPRTTPFELHPFMQFLEEFTDNFRLSDRGRQA